MPIWAISLNRLLLAGQAWAIAQRIKLKVYTVQHVCKLFTNLKSAEHFRKLTSSRYDTFRKSLPVPIFIVTKFNQVLLWNRLNPTKPSNLSAGLVHAFARVSCICVWFRQRLNFCRASCFCLQSHKWQQHCCLSGISNYCVKLHNDAVQLTGTCP